MIKIRGGKHFRIEQCEIGIAPPKRVYGTFPKSDRQVGQTETGVSKNTGTVNEAAVEPEHPLVTANCSLLFVEAALKVRHIIMQSELKRK